jgi:hypothetical protein
LDLRNHSKDDFEEDLEIGAALPTIPGCRALMYAKSERCTNEAFIVKSAQSRAILRQALGVG